VLFLPGGLESIPRRIRARFWRLPDDKENQKSILKAFGKGRK